MIQSSLGRRSRNGLAYRVAGGGGGHVLSLLPPPASQTSELLFAAVFEALFGRQSEQCSGQLECVECLSPNIDSCDAARFARAGGELVRVCQPALGRQTSGFPSILG